MYVAVITAVLPAVSYAAIPSTHYVANADHLDTGNVKTELLHVYNRADTVDKKIEAADTVAAGNDVRFNTVQIGQPEAITADNVTGDTSNRALIWIE